MIDKAKQEECVQSLLREVLELDEPLSEEVAFHMFRVAYMRGYQDALFSDDEPTAA